MTIKINGQMVSTSIQIAEVSLEIGNVAPIIETDFRNGIIRDENLSFCGCCENVIFHANNKS